LRPLWLDGCSAKRGSRCVSTWGYDNEYKRVLVVWFTNPLPMKGKPVERELPVLAHINLRNPAQGTTEQIPTAYWVEEMGYQVNLGMGHNRGVKLGHIENRKFYRILGR
jgi:hypothetical protein